MSAAGGLQAALVPVPTGLEHSGWLLPTPVLSYPAWVPPEPSGWKSICFPPVRGAEDGNGIDLMAVMEWDRVE